jgi:hypothetical protein
LDALRSQTVPFAELVVWCNDVRHIPAEEPRQHESFVYCTKNWGVWPRFFFGLHLDVDYVAVFDDDTIPGHRWFENCLATLQKTGPAVLGACGIGFKDGTREQVICLGWKYPCDQIVEADIVGHAWFFPRDLLREFPDAPRFLKNPTCGEDYYLSVVAQRRGMKTYCPSHPPDQPELWGASQDAMQLGSDDVALWRQSGAVEDKWRAHDLYRRIGWEPDAVSGSDDQVQLRGIR